MNRLARLFLLLAVSTMPAIASAAVAQRTFVASNGIDTNACTLAAPCRSFAGALARTNAGGEVIVLDSAGYGPVTIAQSVSIIAPAGVYAGISVFTGNGVTITTPGITVTLRGLSINGQGGSNGIFYLPGPALPTTLHVEHCVVSGMAAGGIVAAYGTLFVSDTDVRDNVGSGVLIGSQAIAALTRVRSLNNGTSSTDAGIVVTGGATAKVTESTIAAKPYVNAITVQSSASLAVTRSAVTTPFGPAIVVRAIAAAQTTDLTVDSSEISALWAETAPGGRVNFAVSRTAFQSDGTVVFADSQSGGEIEGIVSQNTLIAGGNAIYAQGVGARLQVAGNSIKGKFVANYCVYVQWNALVVVSGNEILGGAGMLADFGGTIQTRSDNTVTGSVSGNVVPIGGH